MPDHPRTESVVQDFSLNNAERSVPKPAEHYVKFPKAQEALLSESHSSCRQGSLREMRAALKSSRTELKQTQKYLNDDLPVCPAPAPATYMSPEQVRGKPADHRSDIFAFASILYEMISGQHAFRGDSPADTMSAILKEEPPELSETSRNVPPA